MQKRGMVFMGMGFEMVGLILASIYIGGVLDEKLNWNGFGTAGMILISMVGWIYHLIVLLQNMMKNQSQEKGPNAD